MKIRQSLLVPIGFLLCILFVCAPGLTAPGYAEDLKDFSTTSFIDNQQINSADMRGKILVMVFGSIYCKPCIELLPVMDELSTRYKNSDVRILLLDIDMEVEQELQHDFVKRHAIRLPYLINALPIARENKVYMLPTTLIVDREGEVLTRIYGFKKISKFDRVIKKQKPVFTVPEPEPHHKEHDTGHQKTHGVSEPDNASATDNASLPDSPKGY